MTASHPFSRRALVLAASGWAVAGVSRASASGLDPLLDQAMSDGAASLLVRRGDHTLAERYAPDWGADRAMEVASVAKSIVAILIGMAIDDGFIRGLDQPAADFIPQWAQDDRRGVTLRHLMSMTSGLDDAGLRLRGVVGDQFALNAAAPLKHPPGEHWAYNTAAYHLLFHILVRATGQALETYARRRLLAPLGMDHTLWITEQGQGVSGPVTNYYSAVSTARDLARLGALVIDRGVWAGQRLVSDAFLDQMTRASQPLNPSYGLLWWCNDRLGFDITGAAQGRRFPLSPPETVAALGAGGQALILVPSKRVIVVRQGRTPRRPELLDAMTATVAA